MVPLDVSERVILPFLPFHFALFLVCDCIIDVTFHAFAPLSRSRDRSRQVGDEPRRPSTRRHVQQPQRPQTRCVCSQGETFQHLSR